MISSSIWTDGHSASPSDIRFYNELEIEELENLLTMLQDPSSEMRKFLCILGNSSRIRIQRENKSPWNFSLHDNYYRDAYHKVYHINKYHKPCGQCLDDQGLKSISAIFVWFIYRDCMYQLSRSYDLFVHMFVRMLVLAEM